MNAKILNGTLVLGLCAVTSLSAKSLEGTRPNIILVLTDDQGMGDFSCLGNDIIRTPNLDQFYSKSTRFTEFHVSPTSAPSRSSIMSGRHEFRNGVSHTILERDIMALSTTTFPQLLQEAGYTTAIFGKWHLGDEDEYLPQRRGFDEVFIHGSGGISQVSSKSSSSDFPPNRGDNTYFDNVLMHNDQIVQTKGYCTDVFFNAALGWIREEEKKDEPYFVYLSLNAPHGPMIAPKSYTKRFDDAGWDDRTAGRYGMIENIDDNFGLFFSKLEQWNALENTLVIFMTDNGQSGRGGTLKGERIALPCGGFKTGKNSPYEGGTHVPSFWYWKDVLPEGQDIGALTAHLDLYNTFCELAGAKIPKGIQPLEGRSLLPLLENSGAKWKDRSLFVHTGRWAKGADPELSKFKGCAVRTQKWRFVNNEELYDIENDPYEKVNVADQHPDVVAKLRKEYDQWWVETLPLLINENRTFSGVSPNIDRYNKQLEKGNGKLPVWECNDL